MDCHLCDGCNKEVTLCLLCPWSQALCYDLKNEIASIQDCVLSGGECPRCSQEGDEFNERTLVGLYLNLPSRFLSQQSVLNILLFREEDRSFLFVFKNSTFLLIFFFNTPHL